MRKIFTSGMGTALILFGLLPHVSSAAQAYTNSDYKVSLNYTGRNMQPTAVSTYIPVQSSLGNSSVDLLALYLRPTIYRGTNLEAVVFGLAVNPTMDQQSCYNLTKNDQTVTLNKVRKVQGNSWHYALPNPDGSAAAGHGAATETYRLYKNSACYEVKLQTSDFDRYNLANPSSVKPYSSTKVFNRLGAVFNQLKVR